MDNMNIYESVRKVPENAQKAIQAGRLKGKTDINPMWRIKALTEVFGPCGIGWAYTIDKQWIEPGAGGEIAAFCNISLRVKVGGEWSEAIPGTGGSAFVASERNGLYTSDECYKMALTDAISVACKALGFGADIYWNADRSKYDRPDEHEKPKTPAIPVILCEECGKEILPKKCNGKLYSASDIVDGAVKSYGRKLCWGCMRAANEKRAALAAKVAEEFPVGGESA